VRGVSRGAGQAQPILQQVVGSNVGEAKALETLEAGTHCASVVWLHNVRSVSLLHAVIRGTHEGQHVVLSRVGVTPFAQVAMVATESIQLHWITGLQDIQPPVVCTVGATFAAHGARRVRSQRVAL
jgi:hypothetical protein